MSRALKALLMGCTLWGSAAAAYGAPRTVAAPGPETRTALFGELHLHTALSFDAWTFGTKIMPDDAYRFAKGETVMVPATQLSKTLGQTAKGPVAAKRSWPLDFAAVTDHSEFLGAVAQTDNPNSPLSQSAFGKALREGGMGVFFRAAVALGSKSGPDMEELKAAAAASDAWTLEQRAANAHYRPGKFTTFIGYEWSASPGAGVHMHRNVIFNADHAPVPFSARDSNLPEDLWKYLGSVRRQGIDALAIPHNSNFSDGRDFDWNMSDGKPVTAAYALERALNEPLVEISQLKGTSETAPDLSPNDEFANFEIADRIYAGQTKSTLHGSYVREAFGRGLVIESKVGANPFKMGMVGGSDIHNGLSASDERAFGGGAFGIDPKTMSLSDTATNLALGQSNGRAGVRPTGQRENDPLQTSSAAITGVWAEANTRESIFAALKRKETFATSGTRIRVRMFGGWALPTNLLAQPDWVKTAYAKGVAMGGDLSAPKAAPGPLRLVVSALKDPSGANLDRIQIVKPWLDGDTSREKIFDVALGGHDRRDPQTGRVRPVANTVDLKTGRFSNSVGAPSLNAVWTDPEFDPKRPAVYYARVMEIPTARWSTLLAIQKHLPLPTKAALTIQERAWTSPIWYSPAVPNPQSATSAKGTQP